MASLAQIAEQVIFKYSGGDASRDSELDPREVQLFVVQELNAIMKVEYWNNIKLDEDHGISGQYILTSQATIQWDNVRNEAYITIPAPYITLGALDRGIQEIRPMDANSHAYIPLANGMNSLARGTRMIHLEGHVGYYPEAAKVYFTTNPKKIGQTQVLVKTIGSTLTNFISDPATEAMLIQNVFTKLNEMRPQDKINNNNPNQ